MVKRSAANKGGNDVVYTPINLCKAVVEYFNPQGSVIEPCEGSGNFTKVLKEHVGVSSVTAIDLDKGVDYLEYKTFNRDWLITNPPFSKLHLFLRKAMQDGNENIVLICYANTFLMNGKMKSLVEFGYSIQEIAFITSPHYHKDNSTFAEEEQWPQSGFALAATHIKKCKHNNPIENQLKVSYLNW